MMAAMTGFPEVGRWREPIMPDLPLTADQVRFARNRPAHLRTDPPAVGDVVGLRLSPAGAVVRARVLRVDMDAPTHTRAGDPIDWNVWRYVVHDPARGPVEVDEIGNRAVELVDDPWPNVLLETIEGAKLRTETREARVPGSPGWLRGKE